ncbi:MAG: hypothetical protein DI536_18680 [Archangium gephyra]|uniref:Uncharacterized protein n=1 Tax=Archangium gephyra TaxID=48 RepID=A0A2W5T828_9BACT|nr:MAG: hypothetical protein DI536_18680 [Archangium gephyra]
MTSLPRVGEVFELAVAPRARVLLRVVSKKEGSWCVVMTRAKAPSSNALFEVQPLTQNGWKRPVLGGWVSEPSPLESLGVVAVRPKERARVQHPKDWVASRKGEDTVVPLMKWGALVELAKKQWQWDHGFTAPAQESGLARLLRASAQQQKSDTYFPAWVGAVTPGLVAAAEAAVTKAKTELASLPDDQVGPRLNRLIKTLVGLGEKHGHLFDDDELDDIDEVARALARGD